MQDLIGRTLGHYRIVDKIGAGGMGEVYRAHDNHLGRDVAIKTLLGSVAQDEQRMARFEREAKLLASLSHQNIATLHGLEEHEGQRYLVMELAEGTTLANRIALRPVPIDDALDYAHKIAEGLEAAHEKGIIHRDHKPANIMLSAEGGIKILDFGLAKGFEPSGSSPSTPESIADSPTLTATVTGTGVLLGTAAYMSPEQARGKRADKRADVWAFGCVLYEMLTGRKAFEGDDTSQTMAAILRDEPDWDALPPATPAHIRRLLQRCLVKKPHDRLHDIADARIELQSLSGDHGNQAEPATHVPAHRGRRAWLPRMVVGIVGLAVGMVATALAFRYLSPIVPPPTSTRLDFVLPSDQHLSGSDRRFLCLSPDGTRLVYVANEKLYLRRMDQSVANPIRGTEGFHPFASSPFFSPDGDYVGFFAGGKLRKISVNGGSPKTLCDVQDLWGASWGEDGNILIGQGPKGIWKVSAEDGAATKLVSVDAEAGESAHGPQLLPDGNHVLFTLNTGRGWNLAQIVAQSLVTGERKTLINDGTDGRFVPTGHLVFMQEGESLFAVALNSDDLEISGERVQVVGNVNRTWGIAQFSTSRTGTLAFAPYPDLSSAHQLIWVDRRGKATPLEIDNKNFGFLSLSPDGTRVAVAITSRSAREIWIYDLLGDRPPYPVRRGGCSWDPVWTPDGRGIIFSYAEVKNSTEDLYWFSADGSDLEPKLLHAQSGQQFPYAVSADGSELFFAHYGGEAKWDMWVLDLKKQSDPRAIFDSENNEWFGTTSPNKRWIAHTSDRTGKEEVWVASYPDLLQRWLISSNGGREPRWSHDGKELYYRSGDRLMVVPVDLDKPEFSFQAPRVLFEGEFWAMGISWPSYGVAPDGRFLMIQEVDQRAITRSSQRIRIVLNWFTELNRLVPMD